MQQDPPSAASGEMKVDFYRWFHPKTCFDGKKVTKRKFSTEVVNVIEIVKISQEI